jgi:hypothetical protein
MLRTLLQAARANDPQADGIHRGRIDSKLVNEVRSQTWRGLLHSASSAEFSENGREI